MFRICGTIHMPQGLNHLASLDLLLSIATTSYWLYILILDTIANLRQPGGNEIHELLKRYLFFTVISIQVTIFGIEVHAFKLLRISTTQIDCKKLYQWIRIQCAFFIVAILGIVCEISLQTLDESSAFLLIKPAFRIYEVFVVTKFLSHLSETGEEVSEEFEIFNGVV